MINIQLKVIIQVIVEMAISKNQLKPALARKNLISPVIAKVNTNPWPLRNIRPLKAMLRKRLSPCMPKA